MIALLFSLILAQTSLPESCHGFLSPACCCTANCCFVINYGDVEPLPDDQWRIKATGQVVKRTDWSKDGRYWRCACEQRNGAWVVDLKDRTRCLYVPLPLG